ncbi:uncharacterized protein L203_105050 [Cryptococcus depauperatus CBS 7841]|uniref:Uncharacterized protein n=1 Tax=Cryptococcus depauperatus CBS 7841 TaxID=1295531 RepID=A0AAJ8M2S3_9TREE
MAPATEPINLSPSSPSSSHLFRSSPHPSSQRQQHPYQPVNKDGGNDQGGNENVYVVIKRCSAGIGPEFVGSKPPVRWRGMGHRDRGKFCEFGGSFGRRLGKCNHWPKAQQQLPSVKKIPFEGPLAISGKIPIPRSERLLDLCGLKTLELQTLKRIFLSSLGLTPRLHILFLCYPQPCSKLRLRLTRYSSLQLVSETLPTKISKGVAEQLHAGRGQG